MSIQTDEGGNFTISALFSALQKADNTTNAIPPMLLKGTAEELDEGFFETITKPAQQTAGLYHNLNEYAQAVEKARLNSKMEQDKKAKAGKAKAGAEPGEEEEEDMEAGEPKPNAEEKRKAFEEAMKRVGELDARCQYAEALEVLPSVTEYPDKGAELTKRKADLERKREQKNKLLF
jgi:PRTRC genetic system protein E